jgi:uncharacterized protein YfdQ (DUF2303 family)
MTSPTPRARTEADAVAEVATRAAAVRVIDVPGLVDGLLVADVGPGRAIEVRDLETHLERPRAKRGKVVVTSPAALVEYVNAHGEEGTTLWADRDAGRIVAVLDDHAGQGIAGAPGWGLHRATLQLRKTPDWLHWTSKDGQLLTQAAFADWLEDGLPAITAPPAAELLEACRTLHVQREVTFSSADRPTTGEIRFVYQETDTAKAGKAGELELPEQITLLLAPWDGCEPRPLTARLRYRLVNGGLTLGYRLVRPHEVLREAWDDVVTRINDATELYVYAGTPRG